MNIIKKWLLKSKSKLLVQRQSEFYFVPFGPFFHSGVWNQELSSFNNKTKVEKFQDPVRYLLIPKGYIPCTPSTPSQH